MEAQQSHIGDERITVGHIREQHTTQLQDAVSRCLPTLSRTDCQHVSDPHDIEDAVQDLSRPLTSTSDSSRQRLR
jgi:hypothetical protein